MLMLWKRIYILMVRGIIPANCEFAVWCLKLVSVLDYYRFALLNDNIFRNMEFVATM